MRYLRVSPMGEGNEPISARPCLKTVTNRPRSAWSRPKIVNMLWNRRRGKVVFTAIKYADLTLKLAEMECE